MKCRCGSSRSAFVKPCEFLVQKKKCRVRKKRMCVSVFLHKHARCYSTFVRGTDFSLAFGLRLCRTNNNLLVCANTLCCFFFCFFVFLSASLFCGCCLCLCVLYCCKLRLILPRYWLNAKHTCDLKSTGRDRWIYGSSAHTPKACLLGA